MIFSDKDPNYNIKPIDIAPIGGAATGANGNESKVNATAKSIYHLQSSEDLLDDTLISDMT